VNEDEKNDFNDNRMIEAHAIAKKVDFNDWSNPV